MPEGADGRCAGLDLDGDYITAGELGQKVDLVTPVFFPQVVQTRAERAQLGFGSDLGARMCR